VLGPEFETVEYVRNLVVVSMEFVFDGGLSACYTLGLASFSSFFILFYGAEGNGMYGI